MFQIDNSFVRLRFSELVVVENVGVFTRRHPTTVVPQNINTSRMLIVC